MAEKTLKTRILVKYDTFANWVEKNPILKAGELAVATIAIGNTEEVNSVETPQVLIKVGDGVNHYTDLKMVSGLSADVYTWAKAATKPSYTAEEIDGLSTYISGQIKDTDTLFKLVATDNTNHHYKLQSKAKGAEDWADIPGSAIIDIPDNTDDINELKSLVGDVAVTTQIANAISALNLADTYATIAYIDDKIAEIPVQASYEIKKLATATDGYLASYQLEKDGAKVGDVINIPKDYLVKSASCKTCTEVGNPIGGLKVGDKYLDFVINVKSGSATDEHIYVNVADLVDTYTAGDNISISDNEISLSPKISWVTSVPEDGGAYELTEFERNYLKMAKDMYGFINTEITPGNVKIRFNGDTTASLQDLPNKLDKVEGKSLIDEGFAEKASSSSDGTVLIGNLTVGGGLTAMYGGIETEAGDVRATVAGDGEPVYHYLSKKANIDDLSSIATSGKVTDLVQAADDVLIFDCGNATI